MPPSSPKFAIRRVAVIGAGVMGAGIAGLLASARIPVILYDQADTNYESKSRSTLAQAAIEKLKSKGGLLAEKFAEYITPANLDDDLMELGTVDWVIEVVVENLQIKQALYARIEPFLKPSTLLSSNTSTIPLGALKKDMMRPRSERFSITHFFNPPLDMPLLELVIDHEFRPDLRATLESFLTERLGKEVVLCHDSPGFIANRIGCYFLELALREAILQGIAVEEVDAIFGKPLGMPSTGVCGLWDLIGIDLMPKIANALVENLPESDAFCQLYTPLPCTQIMIQEGYTGRKGKGGFYRITKVNGEKNREVRDFVTGQYRPYEKPDVSFIASNQAPFVTLLSSTHRLAGYAKKIVLHTLHYAASLLPEVADSLHAIDKAMCCGYAWQLGPFSMIDALAQDGKSGPEVFAKWLKAEGLSVPPIVKAAGNQNFYRQQDAGSFSAMMLNGKYQSIEEDKAYFPLLYLPSKPIAKNASMALTEVDEAVLCLSFSTKMNTLNQEIFLSILEAISRAEKEKKALLIASDGDHFSAGANLEMLLGYAEAEKWQELDALLALGQKAMLAMLQAKIPVIAAVRGVALGGGCEIILHSHIVQTVPRVTVGLVETQVGVIPGWGGCAAMIYKAILSPTPEENLAAAYVQICQAKKTFTCYEAQESNYMPEDKMVVTMHPRRLISEAISTAKACLKTHSPTVVPVLLPMPDTSLLRAKADIMVIDTTDEHEQLIRRRLEHVFKAGDAPHTTMADLHRLEREVFLELIHTKVAQERMAKFVR